MDHNSGAFYFIMILLVLFGVGATAVYYFFRFGIKTDFDKDQEKAISESTEPKALPVESKDSLSQQLSEAEDKAKSEKLVEPVPQKVPVSEPPKPKEISSALEATRSSFFSKLKSVFSGEQKLSDDELESLEEILYTSDLGPQTVQRLMESVEQQLSGAEKKDLDKVVGSLKLEMNKIFSELDTEKKDPETLEQAFEWPTESGHLQVWLIVGVNGAGKTTTIGKLANLVAKKGLKAMVAAGDTFRAAAGEQLKAWSERAQVEIFSPENVMDPSAVAFDACSMAKAKGFDVVIIDTAGRLHTHKNLMEELKKMKRVVQKVVPDAPHEALLVLDANSGQNALIQAKEFNQAIELSGAILTKLDGSAKGGVAVGLAYEIGLPVRLVGVGEGIDDLRPFKSREFVDSIL